MSSIQLFNENSSHNLNDPKGACCGLGSLALLQSLQSLESLQTLRLRAFARLSVDQMTRRTTRPQNGKRRREEGKKEREEGREYRDRV